jgi:exonuclease III
MTKKVTLLSWNMKQKASNWQTVLDSEVDTALLQEAKAPPDELRAEILPDRESEWCDSGLSWRAAVVGLVKTDKIEFAPIKIQPLGGSNPEALMVSRPGSMAAAVMKIKETGEEIILVSMYAHWMSPIQMAASKWIFADASAHRLISDLCGLIGHQKGHKIIVAGDLNILYGYGEDGNLYWGNRYNNVFERMRALGFCFVGPQAPLGGRQADPWPKELPEHSLNVPTFYHNRQTPATATRQLDYVFASESIADRVMVRALNSLEEWGPSDHCRIIIELKDL